MTVVVALDAFKGCLSAAEACAAVAAGLRAGDPDVQVRVRPMADGGEGTAAALLTARPGGVWIPCEVTDPLLGQSVEAGYAWFADDRIAVVEMAAASGLPLLADHERDPMRTTTFGTGQLLAAAAARGARRILLTIGGSATVDGGVGAAAALGWRFLGADGRDVPPDGGHLAEIARIVPPVSGRLPPVTVLCDVTNPLCGTRGAAAVFGPQKGATPAMVVRLDAGLRHLAGRIAADLGREVLDLPGGGAAGGLGAGAAAFFAADLAPGIDTVIEAAGLRTALPGADWCITGEGCLDNSSLHGKVVSGVAAAARACGVPVVVFAGEVRLDAAICRPYGICESRALRPPGMPLAESLRRGAEFLYDTAFRWMKERHEGEGIA